MIECIDLIKIYSDEERNLQVPALRGCDLKVEEGQIASIIGPSGSGKTTLINILAGLETKSSGSVVVSGYSLDTLSPKEMSVYRLKKIGLVDQFPERTLFLNTTVINNLLFFRTLTQIKADINSQRLQMILEKLGISHLQTRIVNTLSGGEMTRVAIACALAKSTSVLLCDEPTGQLDSTNTEAVKGLLRKVAQEFKTTVLVVTHDYRFLDGMDKTFEIIDGRLAAITSQKEEPKDKTSFPLKIKSYIDSTKHARIPDVITESLGLQSEIEFIVGKKGTVSITHPDHLPPKKIILEEPKKRKRVLKLSPLEEDYYINKNLAVQLQNVSKTFVTKNQQVQALDNINLTFYKGESIFLVGPSGSGKSTLLNLIAGLESPSNGIITLLGKPVSTFSDTKKALFRRKNIGMISQLGNLHPFLTIEENLFLKEIYDGQTITLTSERKSNSRDCLTKYNISHKHDFFPMEISGGELQRASIAVALFNKLPILLFDEPTANLDSSLASTIIREILQIPEQTIATLIIATHDFSIINQGARVIELVDGKIKQEGFIS
ncbi:MAG TPA: ATP-binding cassette domain-containing protein [candidate division Zixibacteria bacterium]|nr:ATP-binding cassette domain-containing protein [candidate division Zixibacteria bacterium]